MFEFDRVDDFDGNATADALAEVRREILAAQAKEFVLAAHWADVHSGDGADEGTPQLPGAERMVAIRGGRNGCVEGCPEIEEYAGAELAALTGRSTVAGEQLIADAVSVRHRHPLLWSAVHAGRAPTWLAAQVARRCIRANLNAVQAEWVDSETTRYVTTLPPKRFLDLVEAKIIGADPDAAEERAKAKALARFVHAGQSDEVGLRTLVARAHAGDITYVIAVLDRIAAILAERGDHRPLDVIRTDALRILANPARALALLTGAVLEESDPHVETPGDLTDATLFPYGNTGGIRDITGAPLPGSCPRLEDLPVLDDDELAELPELRLLSSVTGVCIGTAVGAPSDCGHGAAGSAERLDGVLMAALVEALDRFDATVFDPLTTVHVHLAEASLADRRGVVRVEQLGPMVLGELRDWLLDPFHPDDLRHRIQLRAVLDAGAVVPVDRYEWPTPMSELATCRTPFEVFPFGTLSSRKADNDHARPYVWDGPPGQTCPENNAKLSRFHHRLKTNGNWVLRQPEPGTYWWRTPHGHWFLVDPDGTHWRGRDPALDAEYLNLEQAA